VEGEYYFDAKPKGFTHGSLTWADAVVPLVFSYPGASAPEDSGDDTVMQGLITFGEEDDGLGRWVQDTA
jgi:hypothetical protein